MKIRVIFASVEFCVLFLRVCNFVLYISACGISCYIFPRVDFPNIYFRVWNFVFLFCFVERALIFPCIYFRVLNFVLYFSACGIVRYIFLRVECALVFCVIYTFENFGTIRYTSEEGIRYAFGILLSIMQL